MNRKEVQAIIDEVDENGDGKLDYKEVTIKSFSCVCKHNWVFDCNYLSKMIIIQVSTMLTLDFTMHFKSVHEHVLTKMCTDAGELNVQCLHDFWIRHLVQGYKNQ